MTLDDNNQLTPDQPKPEPTPQPKPAPEEPLRIVQPIPIPVARAVKKPVSVWRIIMGVFFGLSVIANIMMLMLVVGMVALSFGGYEETYRQDVLQAGPRDSKIIVITLNGVIDDKMSESIIKQVDCVKQERGVKAMILQINSPGGGVAASDRIYNAVSSLKDDGIPTVACMQDVAASGGYYSAVGCDSIVAEPTTITGSIGVIMETFVVQELLENKLGIQPVVIKAGGKKDWGSPFKPISDEQKAYFEERLIQPAYKRFVSVVKEGRPGLTGDQVEELADGSIYTGDQATKVGLVDKVGYMKDAIAEAMKLAKVRNAEVVRYKEPLTLSEILTGADGRTSIFKIDRTALSELASPQLMYLWSY